MSQCESPNRTTKPRTRFRHYGAVWKKRPENNRNKKMTTAAATNNLVYFCILSGDRGRNSVTKITRPRWRTGHAAKLSGNNGQGFRAPYGSVVKLGPGLKIHSNPSLCFVRRTDASQGVVLLRRFSSGSPFMSHN